MSCVKACCLEQVGASGGNSRLPVTQHGCRYNLPYPGARLSPVSKVLCPAGTVISRLGNCLRTSWNLQVQSGFLRKADCSGKSGVTKCFRGWKVARVLSLERCTITPLCPCKLKRQFEFYIVFIKNIVLVLIPFNHSEFKATASNCTGLHGEMDMARVVLCRSSPQPSAGAGPPTKAQRSCLQEARIPGTNHEGCWQSDQRLSQSWPPPS